MGKRSLTCKLQ